MTAYPLAWPPGWKRTPVAARRPAKFSHHAQTLSVADGTRRVVAELARMGVALDDVVISTNVVLRLDGLPRSNERAPADPGVAVYWRTRRGDPHKVMAIDHYTTVADNLAAIAATLSAMRAIERHGGAVILERAFLGFLALSAPNTWRAVLGYAAEQSVTLDEVRCVYRKKAFNAHPDRGGSEARMADLNWAMQEAERELR